MTISDNEKNLDPNLQMAELSKKPRWFNYGAYAKAGIVAAFTTIGYLTIRFWNWSDSEHYDEIHLQSEGGSLNRAVGMNEIAHSNNSFNGGSFNGDSSNLKKNDFTEQHRRGVVMPVNGEFQVNTHTMESQSSPSIAGLSEGDFVVVWHSSGRQDGSGWGVYGQRYQSNADTVGDEFQINTYTEGTQTFPSVSALAEGGFVVVWDSFDQVGSGSREDIYGQCYFANGTSMGNEFLVNTYTTDAQTQACVAGLKNGGFAVIWTSLGQDGNIHGVFGQRFMTNATKLGSEFPVNTHTASFQNFPAVAALADGGFVVMWMGGSGQDMDGYGIYGQRFDENGAYIGDEFQVNTYTSGNQLYPSVASLLEGGFVATWVSDGQDLDDYGIFAQRFNSDGITLGNEFQVNTYTMSLQTDPVVSMLADGSFVVVWESLNQDGSITGIYGQRFNNAGATIASEFQINTYTMSIQDSPDVVMLTNGGFVAVWQSAEQDDNTYGVYAQRYESPPPASSTTSSMSVMSSATSDGSSIPSMSSTTAKPTDTLPSSSASSSKASTGISSTSNDSKITNSLGTSNTETTASTTVLSQTDNCRSAKGPVLQEILLDRLDEVDGEEFSITIPKQTFFHEEDDLALSAMYCKEGEEPPCNNKLPSDWEETFDPIGKLQVTSPKTGEKSYSFFATDSCDKQVSAHLQVKVNSEKFLDTPMGLAITIGTPILGTAIGVAAKLVRGRIKKRKKKQDEKNALKIEENAENNIQEISMDQYSDSGKSEGDEASVTTDHSESTSASNKGL